MKTGKEHTMAMRLVRDDEAKEPPQVPEEVRKLFEEARAKFGGVNNAAHRPDEEVQQVVDTIADTLRDCGIEPEPKLFELLEDLFRA